MPPGQNFCTTVFYSSLPSIWYATWLCLYKKDFEPFGATPPGPVPRGHIKIRMCSPSPHPQGYRLWKFRDSSINGLGTMMWHYRRTYVRTDGGYHDIPAFSPKSAGIIIHSSFGNCTPTEVGKTRCAGFRLSEVIFGRRLLLWTRNGRWSRC